MQAITWSEEEFQASVSAKLALLRANRQEDGKFNLDQRLELAQDRLNFSERQRAAQAARVLASPPPGAHTTRPAAMNRRADQTSLPRPSGDHLSMKHFGNEPSSVENLRKDTDSLGDSQLFDDYAGQPSKTANVRPDMSRAVESHAVSMTLKPGRPSTFVPHVIRYQQSASKPDMNVETKNDVRPSALSSVQKHANGPTDSDYTELPSDKVRVKPASLYAEEPQAEAVLDAAQIQRRRLVEQTQRQSSTDWVVIDRATVLNCLSQRPDGMTMSDLATFLLGRAARARDIRRLSALIKREAARSTITHSGRGNPITITAKGKAELSAMDINTAAIAAVEKRQKRVNSQARRLIFGG
jgi:hypothetical protein